MTFTHIQIATALAGIIGWAAAHVAGWLTEAHAPAWVLGYVTTVLAALAGVLPTLVWNQNDPWQAYLANVFVALLGAFFAHKTKGPVTIQRRTIGVIGPRRPPAQ